MFRLSRRQPASNDQGSVLIAVIGVMAVAVIVSVAVASVTLSSLGYTSATRNGVQAQAAAEAGIDSTEASMAKTACVASYTSSTAPKFTVNVSYSAQDAGDTSWVPGCAVPGAKRVKLVSTGTAPTIAATGNTAGNTRVVEAIYSAPIPDSSIAATGPAVYAHSATGFNGSGKLVSVDGSSPSVLLRKDSAICDGSSIVGGDLVTAEGNITISASCKVAGDAWAGGTVTTSGNVSVGGDVTSRSTGTTSMSLTGVKVGGNAWAAGTMKMSQSTVEGNITAPALDLVGATVKGNAWAAGAATIGEGTTIGGLLTAKSSNKPSVAASNSIQPGGPGPGPAAGPTPVVPDWVDFDYDLADWKGFQQKVISGDCDWTKISDAATLLAGGPGVIDARMCTNALSISNWQKLPLGNDLAIIAKSFDLAGSSGFTATAERKLWLIEPDTVADGKPTCPSGGYFTVGGAFTLSTNVRAMIYSPCLVSITAGIDWFGQVFSGKVVINGDATLHFVPVGLPGVNLSEGTVTVPGGAGALGARISIRDLGTSG